MPTPAPERDAARRFAELFDAGHRALLAYAVRRIADPADAADVVAETYLVAWRRIDEVPDGDDVRPWLFGVARRVLANFRRGERRRLALAERLRTHVDDIVPPPAEPGGSDVERALARLGTDDQEVLRLVAWEELARDEIALVLGVSRATVRVRLHRARRRLAEQLEALAADDGTAESAAAREALRAGAGPDTGGRGRATARRRPGRETEGVR